MKTMKALVIEKDFSYTLKELPIPKFGEYQALVKVQASAVCGTDLKLLRGKFQGFTNYPTILGHEAVGVVVKRGAKVRNYDIGDMILHPALFDTIDGHYSSFGAMAEYSLIEDHKALLQDGIPIDEIHHHDISRIQCKISSQLKPIPATMLITFREVMTAYNRVGVKPGQSLVLYGLGPAGQVVLNLCKQAGVKTVVITRRAETAQFAKELGADFAIDSSVENATLQVRKYFPDGVDVVWDAAGLTSVINDGLQMIKLFGKIVLYGVMADTNCMLDWKGKPLSFELIFYQWPDMNAEIEIIDELVEMMLDGRINGMDYISDVLPFSKAVEGIDMFLERRNRKKIVFDFSE